MPPPFRLAVVGAGPSAFYTASRVLSRLPEAKVDLFDRLWAPHGLVRYGVAPDHPEVKNCIHKFDETAADPRLRFFGNVTFATQQDPSSHALRHALTLPLSSLFPHYTHLLLAYGASLPNSLRSLNSSFTLSALSLVHWYTGHPLAAHLPPPPLSNTRHLTLVGHGNVSLDIARLLLSDPKSLSSLDIPQHVIDHLQTSSIEHINIVSRRGPAQVAFTAKELREMMNLPGTALRPFSPSTFDSLANDSKPNLTRQQTRILDLMKKGSKEKYGYTSKSWSLEFFRTPISTSVDEKGRKAITFDINTLDDQGRAKPTGEKESQQTDLIATSLGYHSDAFSASVHNQTPSPPGGLSSSIGSAQEVAREDQWHDPILGRVRTSSHGRVMDAEGRRVTNVYASGWAANGARGVIASSMYDAYDVADTMVADHLMSSQSVADQEPFESAIFPMATSESMASVSENTHTYPDWLEKAVHANRGKRVVTYDMWQRVNAEEIRRGQLLGKERERMTWEEVDTFLA